jgi:hypothetical protein
MDELDKVGSFKIPRRNGVSGFGSLQQGFTGKTRVEVDEISKLFSCSNTAGQILSRWGFFESPGKTASFLCMAKHSSSLRSAGEGACLEGGKQRTYSYLGDKWLPPPQSRLIHHPLQGLACYARVCELIDPHTRWWNYDLIQTIFEPWEAGQIYNLVLSPLGHADQVVWQGTKHGLFSVKSAYHLEMQHRNQSRGESSKTGQVERF